MKGQLHWLGHGGPLRGWTTREPHRPPTTEAAVAFAELPVMGCGWAFTDSARAQGVFTSRVRDVMREGMTVFFTTENSRYRLILDP